jgi:hypothetical protein
MAEQLMQDYPLVVGWKFVILKGLRFSCIQKWAHFCYTTSCAHAVRKDYIFEPAFFAYIVVLLIIITHCSLLN